MRNQSIGAFHCMNGCEFIQCLWCLAVVSTLINENLWNILCRRDREIRFRFGLRHLAVITTRGPKGEIAFIR
jgi:hypothetical protein